MSISEEESLKSVTTDEEDSSLLKKNIATSTNKVVARSPKLKWSLEEKGIIQRAVENNASLESMIPSFRSIKSGRSVTAIAVRFKAEWKKQKKQNIRTYKRLKAQHKKHPLQHLTSIQRNIQILYDEVRLIRNSELPKYLKDEFCKTKNARIDYAFEQMIDSL
jgi:hypothetical protein